MPDGTARPAEATRRTGPDQLVVALAHERLVLQAVQDLADVPARVRERDDELRLTLVDLPREPLLAFARRQPDARQGEPALDVLLRLVYGHFASTYSHWVPTMGKNRALAHVTHNITGGGSGAPRPARAVELGGRSLLRGPGPGAQAGVGIVDTGIYPHPALIGSYLADDDAATGALGPEPEFAAGHGTFIAGCVLAEAPAAWLHVVNGLGETGEADSWDLARRLVRLGRAGVSVVNMSFGCLTDDDEAPLVLSTAVDRLDADTVLVAAAGNHGSPGDDARRPLWPAALDDVVAVGATDAAGGPVPWSQAPDVAPWLDVLARGVDVVSTYLPGTVRDGGRLLGPFPDAFASWDGTSFAAARVSGAIAARVRPGRGGAQQGLAYLLAEHGQEGSSRAGLPWLP